MKPGTVRLTADEAIRLRHTKKVLASAELPTRDCSATVDELMALASWAPFHRACDESHRTARDGANPTLNAIEPWRFYALKAVDCRRLPALLPTENAGKIPAMLAAADALILATWLPNPANSPPPTTATGEPIADWFEPTLANMEHIAAASAAVQNLLLAATARGIDNYWSSGGVLRSTEIFSRLGISMAEIMLGAIFLFPQDTKDAECVGSKLRAHRSPASAWSRWFSLPE